MHDNSLFTTNKIPLCSSSSFTLSILLWVGPLKGKSTCCSQPPWLASAAAARQCREIFASCSFFVHLHTKKQESPSSRVCCCRPDHRACLLAAQRGANVIHQSIMVLIRMSKLQQMVSHPLDLAILGSLKTHRFPHTTTSTFYGFYILGCILLDQFDH